jgi:hypothetical protein
MEGNVLQGGITADRLARYEDGFIREACAKGGDSAVKRYLALLD